MQKIFFLLFTLLTFTLTKAVNINQLNHKSYSVKTPVFLSSEKKKNSTFILNTADSCKTNFPGETENIEKDEYGAIVRINPEKKNIYLVFTADSLFDGGEQILHILKMHQIKGSFFFTGNFLRNRNHKRIIKKIIKAGHYVGPHSDKNLLYCARGNRDSTLISFEEFKIDLENNYKELLKFGVQREKATFFMPPFEWYNNEIVTWSKKLGVEVVSFTPGTGTNLDTTTPEMGNYKSSEEIWSNLKEFEQYNPEHLNGAILLIHPGTKPERKDKFYNLLDEIIEFSYTNGYRFLKLKN